MLLNQSPAAKDECLTAKVRALDEVTKRGRRRSAAGDARNRRRAHAVAARPLPDVRGASRAQEDRDAAQHRRGRGGTAPGIAAAAGAAALALPWSMRRERTRHRSLRSCRGGAPCRCAERRASDERDADSLDRKLDQVVDARRQASRERRQTARERRSPRRKSTRISRFRASSTCPSA